MKEYIDYLFCDEESGEEFFVEVERKKGAREEAKTIAANYFDEATIIGVYSPEQAKMIGLDTY